MLIGPTTRFAMVGSGAGTGTFDDRYDNSEVSALFSYVYIDRIKQLQDRIKYQDWALDSGAFSAMSLGVEICNHEYTEFVRKSFDGDASLTDAFGLDVIGDPAASSKNVEYSWNQNVPVIPTFHYGSDFDELIDIAKNYPKIALGGCARMHKSKKTKWAKRCFRVLWQNGLMTKVHGLGFDADYLLSMPFHSVDSTNWVLGPSGFGNWKTFDRTVQPKALKGAFRREADFQLRTQRKARFLNRKIMLRIHEAVCARFNIENSLRGLK